MTMFNTLGSGSTHLNLHSIPQRLSSMEEMYGYLYGGITMILFILSFWNVIRCSMQIYTLSSGNMWMKIILRKGPAIINSKNVVLLHDK